MNNNTEYIARYLQNDISQEEKIAFEKQLAVDKELQKEFFIQQQIMKAATTAGLKGEFSKAFSKKIITQRFLKWGIVGTVLVAAFVFYAIKTNLFSKTHSEKYKAEEYFKINNTKDTIIETKDGVVFAIPAYAFKTENENIRLEIKTAISPDDIMRQGLSTTSNGSLLQTAGMFYINGYDGDQPISLQKNISVSVPANEINPNMRLFKGVEDKNGQVNWIDPKPINNDLRTYDITTLDFYPPDYIPALKELGKDYTNKRYTDSLYYSFSGYPYAPEPELELSGKAIFMQYCASCHNMEKDIVGPALKGVVDRWGGNRDNLKLWIKNYSKAVAAGIPRAKEIVSFSPTAQTMFEGVLTDRQLDALINYLAEWNSSAPAAPTNTDDYEISSADPVPATDTAGKPVFDVMRADSTIKIYTDQYHKADTVSYYYHFELDPSRIHAIWGERFNNTILATKEFEERLRYMHTLCTSIFFETYLNNLDKPLYEIDQLCADMTSGDERKKFLEFAARKNGGVRIKEGMQQQLSDYFQKKYKAYQDAVLETMAKYEAELEKLDQIADDEKREQEIKDLVRKDENFQEELCANLTDAYKQIGIERKCERNGDTIVPPPPARYDVVINTPGWYNLDVYVFDATVTRQSMTYTDPATGKQAVLTYKDVTITIDDQAAYDKVFVYLVPDSLTSFQRIEQGGTVFKERLNMLFRYDAVVIGFKGTQPYYYKQANLQPGEHHFSLSTISDQELKDAVKEYSGKKSKAIKDEFAFRLFEQQEIARQIQLRKDREFRQQIADIIFPCGEEGGTYPLDWNRQK